MALLVELILGEGAIDKLSAFTSSNGASHYGVKPTTEVITIVQDEWTVFLSSNIVKMNLPFMRTIISSIKQATRYD